MIRSIIGLSVAQADDECQRCQVFGGRLPQATPRVFREDEGCPASSARRGATVGRLAILMSMAPTACVSMRGFLRSGEFGPVRLGDSVDKLRGIFGEPPLPLNALSLGVGNERLDSCLDSVSIQSFVPRKAKQLDCTHQAVHFRWLVLYANPGLGVAMLLPGLQ